MSLFLGACAVLGLGAAGLLLIMVLGAREAAKASAKSITGPTPETARIQAQTKTAGDALAAQADADKERVQNASKSDLLDGLRDSVRGPK